MVSCDGQVKRLIWCLIFHEWHTHSQRKSSWWRFWLATLASQSKISQNHYPFTFTNNIITQNEYLKCCIIEIWVHWDMSDLTIVFFHEVNFCEKLLAREVTNHRMRRFTGSLLLTFKSGSSLHTKESNQLNIKNQSKSRLELFSPLSLASFWVRLAALGVLHHSLFSFRVFFRQTCKIYTQVYFGKSRIRAVLTELNERFSTPCLTLS